MSKIGLIGSLYKGFSFYLLKEKSNLILKDLIAKISEQKDFIKHFFIYFDNRFECRFRLFVCSELSSEELNSLLVDFLQPYVVPNEAFIVPNQLFKTFSPYSIASIAFIDHSDEIYTFRHNSKAMIHYLETLTNLIAKKSGEVDFEDDNQRLEFVLELLLSSYHYFEVSVGMLHQYYKSSCKHDAKYKQHLENQYGTLIDQNKADIRLFRESLLMKENADNLFNVFWKENHLDNYKLVLELIFKVLNTSPKHQSYCLYVLYKNAEK